MSTYKTEGIIIKREYFGEASLMMGIYTREYGKIRAVARSARKKKGKLKGHLELFLDVELMLVHGRNIDTIASSLTVKNFSRIRSNLKLLPAAYLIIELADKFTAEGHRDERIFWLLLRSLEELDSLIEKPIPSSSSLKDGARQEGNLEKVISKNLPSPLLQKGKAIVGTGLNLVSIIVLFFQIHLLNLTGFTPELNKCVLCGKPIKPNKNYFSVSGGGIIGEECFVKNRDMRPISVEMIKLLRLFQLGKNNFNIKEYQNRINYHFEIIKKLRIDKEIVEKCIFLMNEFIEFSIDEKIKGIEFFKEMGIMKEKKE